MRLVGQTAFLLDEASNFFKNVLHAQSVSGAVAQEEHGVHTVFVELNNTKIEVDALSVCA
jgi:methylmalonyl-CoA/ethylmalonyl-CoA epimerase